MKSGLVLEGGAHRAIYTAGVLDVLNENNIEFDGVIGVSAGLFMAALLFQNKSVAALVTL